MSESEGKSQPNVLFIICDQLRADHLSYAGNPIVRTPNIDSIAERAAVFTNAWVANPVCMPNRSTLMTGRLPTAHGVIFNDRSLDWGTNTHVRCFREAGYRTALIGKSHLQHGLSRNATWPVDAAPVSVDPWPTGWNKLEHAERYDDGQLPDWPDDFYGFGHVELSIDHGARITGHHLHWALDRGGRYEDLVVPMTEESPARRRSSRWWQIYEPPYGPELHSTTFVTERTINFIESATADGQPWLVWASFPDPHHPVTPPGEWYERHDPAAMPLPPTINDPMELAPQYLRHLQGRTVADMRNWVDMFGASDHEIVRECIAATYGAIEMIDDGVGQLVAAVERLGATDDTIVVFTSDHGDMMGDHGLMTKGFMHYRGTLQPPLLIADSRRQAAQVVGIAGSIDLAPTLLDLADISSHDGIQGRSLVPMMDDPSATVNEHLLIEDDLPAHLAKRSPIPEKTRTLISGRLKYTRHSTGEEQLFDLEQDPDEMRPIHTTDPRRRAEAVERFAVAMLEADDTARGNPVRRG